jgi:RimJ/RimL family protein N-acetyltransferase
VIDPPGDVALTERLAITPLRAAHAPLLYPLLADARLYRYVPDAARACVADLWRRFEELEHGPPPGEDEHWLNWVLLGPDGGAPAGTLQATVTPDARAWIGYVLVPSAWGQGYATEACTWLVGELAARHGVREILASVDVRNVKSVAVLERVGFERVAMHAAELRGEATTDFVYRVLCAP